LFPNLKRSTLNYKKGCI